MLQINAYCPQKVYIKMSILLVKSYEKSVKSWVKSKICTPFLGVGDPSDLNMIYKLNIILQTCNIANIAIEFIFT